MIDNITSSTTLQHAEDKTKSVRRFIRKFLNDWSLDLASIVAYNFLVSLLPIVITLFGLVGLILRDRPQAQQDLKDKIIHTFPSDNATQSGVRQMVDLAFDQLSRDAGVIFATGIIFAMFGSSRLFIAIDKCMTIIYRLPERSFLRQNLMALGILFLLMIIIFSMLVASSVPSALINTISGGTAQFGVFIGGIIISLAIAFALFETIYWITPNKKMTWKTTWCGALVAAVILEVFIILFPLYVRQFMGSYAGQIGFAVILILFLYYFAIILILGAQINAYFFEQHPPLADTLGTYLSQMYEEHGPGKTKDSLHDVHQHRSAGWMNKCCFCKKRHHVETQALEDNHI